VFDK
jgi:hypothetical protein